MNIKIKGEKVKQVLRQINASTNKKKKKPLLMEYFLIPQDLILNGKKMDFRKENFR